MLLMVPEALTLLILIGLPWLTLGMLLLFNPRYELHLFDPGMPGISLLLAAFVAQLVGAVTAYSAQAVVKSLGQRGGPVQPKRVIIPLLIGVAFSALCTLPMLVLVILGPAAIVLVEATMP
jgi:hypothetical protein